MNRAQTSKPRNLEKTFPRCLGRMVNLLDLNASLAGSRFLPEKPHHDGPSLSLGQSDAVRMSPIVDPIEDKEIVSELRRSSSNKQSNLTPMKMLIAQEMSKEVEPKCSPPCVVAKLMGLDALPQQRPDSAGQRSHSRSYSQSCLGIPLEYWPQEDELEIHMQQEIRYGQSESDFKDVYEIWQESDKGCHARESQQKGWRSESIDEKKMDLVRQKFTEAKRLATDEKLRQSKQFHDAVEVLSSNKDFFLKLLQEPNSLYSQHLLGDFQSVPPETKRITVLRPSNVVDNKKNSGLGKKDEKQMKRASDVDQLIDWGKSGNGFPPNSRVNDNPTPPTRIVVLKPSLGKSHDFKAVVSPPPSSPGVLHSHELCREREDDETQESGEGAKETTWPIRANLSGHRRDETLLSSVFSNDCIGYESSFNKSENEYPVGNNGEIEIESPIYGHSWDYINGSASRYSSSSFSRPSCSHESSVTREAKRRLSERWAMMASNGNVQEQRHARSSSGTLGEMLALSDTKSSVRSKERGTKKEQEPRRSKSSLASDLNKDENVDNSPRKLLRSKSLPVSSTLFGDRLNVEVPDPEVGVRQDSKEVTKQRNAKSSFRGKVSSLFFLRTKNSSKAKSSASQLKAESKISAGMVINATEDSRDDASQCASDSGIEEGSLRNVGGSSSKTPFPNVVGPRQATISPEARLLLIHPEVSGYPYENQDQPSPISILEPPFLEDDSLKSESHNLNADKHGAKLSAHSLRSNLIDKSPPIGSIARTLSWDDSCVETASSYQPKPALVSQEPEVEEQEWLFHIQSLLSAAGLDGEEQSDSFFPRWHSPESLLDPSLREKYTDINNEEIIHEAKRRKMRSTRKLVFDCVNAALVDISGYGSGTSLRATPSPTLVYRVRDWMKEWCPSEVTCFSVVGGDAHSLVVDAAVRKDVVGKGWGEQRSLEIDSIGKEIEGRLVEELVHEAVVELIGKVC